MDSPADSRVYDNSAPRRKLYRALRKAQLWTWRQAAPIIGQDTYMRGLCAALRRHGMVISGQPLYISPQAWFDGYDYALIALADRVVVSHDVRFLTHDFSISRARDAISGERIEPEVAIARPIRIGENSFLGMGALLLPGAEVGRDCIVGAGSVVRGKVPDGSIVAGNPAVVVGETRVWGQRRLEALNLGPK